MRRGGQRVENISPVLFCFCFCPEPALRIHSNSQRATIAVPPRPKALPTHKPILRCQISDGGLWVFAERGADVHKIDVSGCRGVSDYSLEFLSASPSLWCLRMRDTDVTDQGCVLLSMHRQGVVAKRNKRNNGPLHCSATNGFVVQWK
jgi:hypothetical protein